MSKLNVEQVKAESHGLRGPLAGDLESADAYLSEAGKVLIKFHGSYEQTNRDKRGAAAKEYIFMVRSKLPGGRLTAAQYLAHDDIATRFGNGTLRITTRQGIQFHGVVKGHLRDTIRSLNHALVTTFGACGDVVRNVMCCPAPSDDPRRVAVQRIADQLSAATLPRTKAYHQIWVDGEAIVADEEDPLYGTTYLPRKFKAAIAFAGDNCMDIFTNDAGLIALFGEDGALAGFNVVAGGGMGVTHNKEATFARLADVIGFVAPEHAVDVVKAIVTVHRDFGDRTNRKHARLKYVLEEQGVEWFRRELQARVPFAIEDPRPMPPFVVLDHLGWTETSPDTWSIGLPVDSGRIADVGPRRLRTGIREVVSRFGASVQLTAQQNILLSGLRDADRGAVEALLAAHGIVTVERISGVRRNSLACPALPTCGLAISEAERVLPRVMGDIDAALADEGLAGLPIVFRMTGCPNGCARPYVAEVALVGRSLDKYLLYLGGDRAGTRLARPFQDLVPLGQVADTLKPLFSRYRDERQGDEGFGDFCDRVGFDVLKATITEAAVAGA
ncbi:sulfite reductase subunit beta [Luteitalea sp. TBR-22]|uniref:NADPH-dependent assimilatory sulfite reductase hemoprotein subunit n=1 Tax=Luteitalea sp. TBR-22 TaxID=2802971 RepID=UPI001AFA830C|nr:NADPH-dependent assimilatory sulfite reductase hemoprotein subunit [Luteitalea sp. TBR-22]BCS32482.1 sulfite reductase subunit beta [Luteitalea sp. TBR-22]